MSWEAVSVGAWRIIEEVKTREVEDGHVPPWEVKGGHPYRIPAGVEHEVVLRDTESGVEATVPYPFNLIERDDGTKAVEFTNPAFATDVLPEVVPLAEGARMSGGSRIRR